MTSFRVLTTTLSLFFLILSTQSTLAQPQTLVVTDFIRKMDFHDQVTLVSRTKAGRSSQVVATITGQVMSIDSEEGVRVKRGTPLVTIEQKRLRLLLEAKEAEAKQAKAQADAAARALQRSRDLYQKQLIPESSIDTDSSTAIAAKERYQQLLAEQERLAYDLERCVIRAPFAGYTGKQLIDVGEWVNPGTPVFEMVDPSKIKVTVDLPERYFGQLSPGSIVTVVSSAGDGRTHTGEVTGISPSAVESTHTFPVFVTVDNRDGQLGGGMLVKATLSLNQQFTSLAVPKDAIVREGLQTSIYTVEDGKAVRISVMTSSSNGQMIAIEGSGLKEGMPVIVRGNERIFPGSPVRLPEGVGESEHSN